MEYITAIIGAAIGASVVYSYMHGQNRDLQKELYLERRKSQHKTNAIDYLNKEAELRDERISRLQAIIDVNKAWLDGVKVGRNQAAMVQRESGSGYKVVAK